MTGQHEGDNGDADRASSEGPQKAQWHAPTLEEVDYSATEATGAGGVYDFTVYSGSTGP